MNKQDLIKGEYYVGTYIGNTTSEFIWKCYTDKSFNYEFRIITNWSENLSFVKYGTHSWNDNIRLATPEEKHWLDECIRLNKFITKEEAIKSFIPEYVKCILKHEEPAGKIYDTKDIIKQEPMREINIKLDSRAYSLDEISKVINDNYEKEDALEIINTIKTIK